MSKAEKILTISQVLYLEMNSLKSIIVFFAYHILNFTIRNTFYIYYNKVPQMFLFHLDFVYSHE